ncbi:uncharacterized protein P174DRAFT_442496 [Aspergillus novofumigatus IBT 16806]|uniref:Uncharacterized protein n=1 Tax=Aspergillus novofumigatus (strain IBT 16806) TaxID=1392255 RepID=A0A2I1C4U6_ASPN1|nr:uncharacterized protein P174DRAFT_442496 [Aspergillus novofumigatus IBT 16806]PKX92635.1 hypothetical protein P174DRAFT_442496 [Aspergillus novofumigatus IBT 16806]
MFGHSSLYGLASGIHDMAVLSLTERPHLPESRCFFRCRMNGQTPTRKTNGKPARKQ